MNIIHALKSIVRSTTKWLQCIHSWTS